MGNAGTRVHRGDEHESTGQRHATRAARDRHVAVFQRLAQYLERGAFELGQFVEEKHAVVSQGNLAGARDCAAAK
jgi:hypothetical protein